MVLVFLRPLQLQVENISIFYGYQLILETHLAWNHQLFQHFGGPTVSFAALHHCSVSAVATNPNFIRFNLIVKSFHLFLLNYLTSRESSYMIPYARSVVLVEIDGLLPLSFVWPNGPLQTVEVGFNDVINFRVLQFWYFLRAWVALVGKLDLVPTSLDFERVASWQGVTKFFQRIRKIEWPDQLGLIAPCPEVINFILGIVLLGLGIEIGV